jgi:ssDNA-binding Zn-finger/Zn-ribbon topoisomerase 1
MSESASKEPKEIVICPKCGKSGGKPAMKRYHFDNCKVYSCV